MKGAINCIKILCSAYFLNSFALVCGQIYENGPPNLHVLNFEILRNWVDTSGYADNPSTNTNWLIAFVHGPCSDCVYESLQIIDLAQYILGESFLKSVENANGSSWGQVNYVCVRNFRKWSRPSNGGFPLR